MFQAKESVAKQNKIMLPFFKKRKRFMFLLRAQICVSCRSVHFGTINTHIKY